MPKKMTIYECAETLGITMSDMCHRLNLSLDECYKLCHLKSPRRIPVVVEEVLILGKNYRSYTRESTTFRTLPQGHF